MSMVSPEEAGSPSHRLPRIIISSLITPQSSASEGSSPVELVLSRPSVLATIGLDPFCRSWSYNRMERNREALTT
ncbi:hypothetical protein CIHG_09004 [Coccidioides immitis H538.4]|uniref:Uncharacterized protein n=3 Tax=Coccidioides immitis TaxID=5501 RepID=A0A0J8TIC9_COCIT|nr:hypothetical protein CIRG_04092 [Coccidioides immitis RMSCC 2394]KMU73537.1 hypothetical protein CISG_03671 [Coccidioides immitis RMSCC 3703]KMU91069.1 hypothetical protein CIHG_09004 [Coccidioides immitis H538.4]